MKSWVKLCQCPRWLCGCLTFPVVGYNSSSPRHLLLKGGCTQARTNERALATYVMSRTAGDPAFGERMSGAISLVAKAIGCRTSVVLAGPLLSSSVVSDYRFMNFCNYRGYVAMGRLKPGHSAYQLTENTFLAQVLRNAKYIGAPATIFTQWDKAKVRETFIGTAMHSAPQLEYSAFLCSHDEASRCNACPPPCVCTKMSLVFCLQTLQSWTTQSMQVCTFSPSLKKISG